ncbi:3-oxoacyl-ACP reductase [Leucobacter allii]|uniref:3-oxoacyl-ACP reductase n=1 Tax=Leucobacter allii TaxID=2932247 RepID=A0ABY4FHG7_9MICO|nr:3-oxoacyl-ACP reductase [Leucobacter allii]UOQ56122.1 3-oxoacyl-ACP reductase [Leucobacter allii]UOR00592.1 3-oxoacyl-ACP reductase [Leucobacter allii]
MSDPTPQAEQPAPRPMPASQPVLLKALRWGLVVTVGLMIVFAVLGLLVSGQPGLWGGVIGTALGGVFLLMTVGSIAFANRFVESDSYIVAFFGIVLGSWVLKFIAFIVAVVLLRDQPWLDTRILFFGVIASVIASLALDVLIIAKSRIPVVSDR